MTSLMKDSTRVHSVATPSETKSFVTFSEKEERVLKAAWSCLKSGPPEVDMKQLAAAAGFNTSKSCSNTWGIIKKKLAQLSAPADGGEVAGKTQPKAKANPKKRSKKTAEGSDEEAAAAAEESPSKKQRKSSTKKKEEDKADEKEEKLGDQKKAEVDVKAIIEAADR